MQLRQYARNHNNSDMDVFFYGIADMLAWWVPSSCCRTPHPEAQNTERREMESAPHPEAQSTERREMERAPHPEAQNTERREMESAPHPEAQNTERREMERAPHQRMTVRATPEEVGGEETSPPVNSAPPPSPAVEKIRNMDMDIADSSDSEESSPSF